jgi:hypothetical protein
MVIRKARNNPDLDLDNAINEAKLSKNDLGLSNDQVKQIWKDPPGEPIFPMLMFISAFIKDVVDTADITGVGIILTTAFSLVFNTILFVWVIGRGGTGGASKVVVKRVLRRLPFTVVVEFIPGLKIIPATTLFVLWVHSKEMKFSVFFRDLLERMKRYK